MEALTAAIAAIQRRRRTTTAVRAEVIAEAQDRMAVQDHTQVLVATALVLTGAADIVNPC
jgi:hypothetical protein